MRNRGIRWLFAGLAMLGMALVAHTVSAGVPAEVDAARNALGFDNLKDGEVCVVSGRSRFMGSDGRFTIAFDKRGQYVEHIDGPISQSVGYDGSSAWETDWNRITRALVLGELHDLLLRAWIATGAWVFLPGGLAVSEATGGGGGLILSFPDGAISATLMVNTESHLPEKFSYSRGAVSTDATLSDYRNARGLRIPYRVEMHSADGNEVIFVTESVAFQSKVDWSRPPRGGESRATFDASAPSELEIRVAPTKHLMVPGRINGKDVGWFIFDSGAGANVVATTLADSMGLEEIGTTPVMGVGGSVTGIIYSAQSLAVGALTLSDPVMVGFDLSPFEPVFGVKLAGIVGYDVLSNAVVQYEFEGPHIKLYDPATYTLENAGWSDLILYDRTSHVNVRFEGHDGIFLLDTGAANKTFGIYAPAVERLQMLTGRETSDAQVMGAGGMLPARAGKLAWVEIGGKRYENVDAIFATEKQGAYADTYVSGTVGGKVLSDFTLVFDYANARIAFVPRDGR